jgi:hypothetical protein
MRIAALYDIHANLPALEAVLEDIRHAEVDLVVIGGDVVPGPMPLSTIECLLNFDIPLRFIYGNGEIAVLERLAGRNPEVPAHYIPVIEWTTRQLQPEYVNLLARWPKTVSAQLQGLGEVLFCHATPRLNFGIHPTDLSKAADCVRATDYPQAQHFAARYILKPPSEKEMLELYARADLS